jgi:hypothetical protein
LFSLIFSCDIVIVWLLYELWGVGWPGGAAGSFIAGLVPGIKRFCRAPGGSWDIV